MTEAEWLTSTDPVALATALTGRVSGRQAVLFGCGCARLVWDDGWPARCQRAVEVMERHADGQATADEVMRARSLTYDAAHRAVNDGRPGHALGRVAQMRERRLMFAADFTLPIRDPVRYVPRLWNNDPALPLTLPLIRCVFGNPFRPPVFDPLWRTAPVLALAETIYADRLFDRLPILADALEEAGCDNSDLLAHCRSDGPHARGCWPVDLVLGKG